MVAEEGGRRADACQAGQRLAARNEFDPNGPIEWKEIEEVFVRQAIILEVTIGGKVIGTTAEHPFYLYGQGWTPAGELQVGDLLATADGRWLPVEKLYNTGKLETVYNFRIADHHTYFVGDADWGFAVWAHNSYSVSVRGVRSANATDVAESALGGPTWGSWDRLPKVSREGRIYANINGRLYTEHAVQHMAPKSFGYAPGRIEARGVPGSVVEEVIQHGKIGGLRPSGSNMRVSKVLGDVEVILENGIVVTVIRH